MNIWIYIEFIVILASMLIRAMGEVTDVQATSKLFIHVDK